MLTLIGTRRTRSFRVLWGLEELGLAYDHRPERPRSDEVRRLNPVTGKIPILLDGDHVLTDSVAILTFLTDREGRLTHPPGSHVRARQDAVTNFALAELDAVLWTAAKHSFVLPEKLRRPEIVEVNAKEWARAAGQLATLLGDGPYLMGDDLTVPDIVAGHCLRWARGLEWPVAPPLEAYAARLAARPAFARAVAS